MTKIKQFSTRFDVLYSRENNPWTGGVQCLTSSGAFFPWDFGQWGFTDVRKGDAETGRGWLGRWDFP